MRSRHYAALAILALAAIASGCGSSGGEGVAQGQSTQTTSNPSKRDTVLAFAACMRKNGVPKFPDPDNRGDLKLSNGMANGRKGGLDVNSSRFKAAQQACLALRPSGRTPDPQTAPEELRLLLRFARCMRSRGVPTFPDPQPNGSTVQTMPQSVDTSSPRFRAAEEACQRLVPGLFGPSHGGTP
jgi:hypothetical protein